MSKPSKTYPGCPSSIKVGNRDFQVRVKTHAQEPGLQGKYGYTSLNHDKIHLAHDLSPGNARATLFHEVLHAVFHTFGRVGVKMDTPKNDEDVFGHWEHYFISAYEETVPLVLRDNPQLVAFLTAGGSK